MLKDLPPKEHRAQCSTNCLLCQYIEQLEAELAKCHQANAEVASINGDLVIENAAAFELLDVYEKENERLREAIEAWVDAHKSGYCTENYLHCTTSDGLRDALEDGE